MNLNNKRFCSIENSGNGEVSGQTIFYYHQEGRNVWAEYSGGSIKRGHLVAIMSDNGELDMRYHHINQSDELMTGVCRSRPEILEDGRVRFYETWQWTCGDGTKGESVIEEIGDENI